MEFSRLEKNIIEIIKEEQIKLWYQEEAIYLYYPLESINRFLKTNLSANEMKKEIEKHFSKTKTILGKVEVSNKNERFCFLVPKTGMK